MAWLTTEQVQALGFAAVGTHVLLSDKASFYNCAEIRIGSNVRIDDFCVLSAGAGGIHIGSYIHLAVFDLLIGAGRISLDDFANLSSRVSVYSSTDDFSGAAMTNPMVPAEFTNVSHAAVHIGRHVVIGSGSVILPGAVLEPGSAVGALSLVKGRCREFGIYAGIPATRIAERKRDLLIAEQRFRASPLSE